MTDDDAQDHPKLELSAAQITGSALAAVSVAVFGSWLGTAGTLVGVAVGSVLATVGTSTYTWWLKRTSHAVRRRAVQVRQTGLHGAVVLPNLDRSDPTPQLPGDEGPRAPGEEDSRWAFLRDRPWGKVLLASAGVMLAALAAITVFESVTGRPISSLLGGDDGRGTTVGRVVGTDDAPTPTPSPTPTPTEEPAPSETPTPTPSETPTSTESAVPSEVPTPTPTDEPLPTEQPSGTATPTP